MRGAESIAALQRYVTDKHIRTAELVRPSGERTTEYFADRLALSWLNNAHVQAYSGQFKQLAAQGLDASNHFSMIVQESLVEILGPEAVTEGLKNAQPLPKLERSEEASPSL